MRELAKQTIQFCNELNKNAIKFCKKLLNSKEYEMHEYSLLREEILN